MKCIQCDTKFEAERSTAKFCSDACKMMYNRIKKGHVPRTPKAPDPVDQHFTSFHEKFSGRIHPLEFITTGIPELDTLTLIPRRRITELYGLEAVGKTSLALQFIAGMTKEGLRVLYIDTEASLDPDRLGLLGADPNLVEIAPEGMVEDVYELVLDAVGGNKFDAIIVDSVAAMSFRTELEGEASASNMGIKAKILNKLMRVITTPLSQSKTALIFINQLRPSVGVMYGPTHYTPGGWGIRYAASLRIELSATKAARFQKDGKVIGHVVKAQIIKSKVGMPWQTTEFKLFYDPRLIADIEAEIVGNPVLDAHG